MQLPQQVINAITDESSKALLRYVLMHRVQVRLLINDLFQPVRAVS
jgi:hypothetical protein